MLASIGQFTKYGILQDGEMRKAGEKWAQALSTKTPSVRQQVRLSLIHI